MKYRFDETENLIRNAEPNEVKEIKKLLPIPSVNVKIVLFNLIVNIQGSTSQVIICYNPKTPALHPRSLSLALAYYYIQIGLFANVGLLVHISNSRYTFQLGVSNITWVNV